MTAFTPTDQIAPDRLTTTEALEANGSDPYPAACARSRPIGSFSDCYEAQDSFPNAETETLAGRVTRLNDLGSIGFIDIADETGTVQLLLGSGQTAEYNAIEQLDRGDFVEATGVPTRTDTGELSLHVDEWRVLAKALRELPSRTGLNAQGRVRDRTGALLVEDDLHESIRTRFELTQEVRSFLIDLDYLEVETPILHPSASGAAAESFDTYCEAQDEQMALRIAPELYLKQLVAGGFDRVFEVAKTFRNEDSDTTHNPEFTMLEAYQAYADYEDMMVLTENLVSHLAHTLTGAYSVEYDGEMLDFEPPWPRHTFDEAFTHYADLDVASQSTAALRDIAMGHGVDIAGDEERSDVLLALYDVLVEPAITSPCFITHQPTGSTPLCKPCRDNPDRLERFEAVVAGVELANAYTELNDPREQAAAFAEQTGGEELSTMEQEYVEAIAYGLPPAGGVGIGLDRLAMLLTDSQSIKDVVPFPMVAST